MPLFSTVCSNLVHIGAQMEQHAQSLEPLCFRAHEVSTCKAQGGAEDSKIRHARHLRGEFLLHVLGRLLVGFALATNAIAPNLAVGIAAWLGGVADEEAESPTIVRGYFIRDISHTNTKDAQSAAHLPLTTPGMEDIIAGAVLTAIN
jgi:hypothetical protein